MGRQEWHVTMSQLITREANFHIASCHFIMGRGNASVAAQLLTNDTATQKVKMVSTIDFYVLL